MIHDYLTTSRGLFGRHRASATEKVIQVWTWSSEDTPAMSELTASALLSIFEAMEDASRPLHSEALWHCLREMKSLWTSQIKRILWSPPPPMLLLQPPIFRFPRSFLPVSPAPSAPIPAFPVPMTFLLIIHEVILFLDRNMSPSYKRRQQAFFEQNTCCNYWTLLVPRSKFCKLQRKTKRPWQVEDVQILPQIDNVYCPGMPATFIQWHTGMVTPTIQRHSQGPVYKTGILNEKNPPEITQT